MKVSNIISVLSLLISNLIPLYGVLFWNWKVFPILVTYWLENVAVGFWNIIKINKCVFAGKIHPTVTTPLYGDSVNSVVKLFLSGFFAVHFGIFTLVHGLFLFIFFGSLTKDGINFPEILIAFVVIFISHGISYYTNFIGHQEFMQTGATSQMFKPYGRIVVMHLVIILGAFFTEANRSSITLLILLIVLKTIADLVSHLQEHKVVNIPLNTSL